MRMSVLLVPRQSLRTEARCGRRADAFERGGRLVVHEILYQIPRSERAATSAQSEGRSTIDSTLRLVLSKEIVTFQNKGDEK